MQTKLIYEGSVFVKGSTPLPNWFRFPCYEYDGWKRVVEVSGYALERTAIGKGWHFFYITPSIECHAFGLTSDSAAHKAFTKVTETVARSGLNAFEIRQVRVKCILGIYSVRITADKRQLNPGPYLRDPDRYRESHSIEDVEHIFSRTTEIPPQVKGI